MLLAAAAGGLRFGAEDFRGQLPASKVKALMASEKLSCDQLMLKLLPQAQSHAHPPISSYFVGAVASGISGALYFGQNIEIDGNPLGLAVHAEQSAIANAYMSGEEGINAISVRGSPCGHCRQFLSEVSLNISMRVLTPDRPEQKLSDLLPNAFGPKNLGFDRGVFPMVRAPLTLLSKNNDPLVKKALDAASQAYAPYSQSPSGAAILTSNGKVFSGSYIENAAFNPSLPPLQAALAGYFAAGQAAGQITRAALVEGQKSKISQHMTSQATLAAFSSSAKLERFVF
jgi:cytidine deaminase